tara:strand:- start:937 stop:2349 length:1413 start_codon:yes stop_codon:yes gene_type:complete
MDNAPIRLRFAPSPTGYLHVGGLRTALYNFLLSRQLNGDLILRIEDTDQSRLVPGAEENLIKTLAWSGIIFNEGPHLEGQHGPYRQSERISIYKKYYIKLIKSGHAYPCFYSQDRLNDLSSGALSSEDATIEDSAFRDFDISDTLNRMERDNFIIRLKIPKGEALNFHDLIKGDITFDLNLIEDPIIIKSDGFPTYHFANVIDDHLMGISHVIRGEEWLPSIPKHIILYKSLNWEPPLFGHLPLLLNNDKSKLSKRKNDVSVENYIQKGYMKEGLINFLALLGWHEKGDREIYNIDELIHSFSLDRVNKSGAVFDIQKLNSFNNHYIKEYKFSDLKILLSTFLPQDWEITQEMVDLVKDKAVTLSDFKQLLSFLFIDKFSFTHDEKILLTSSSGDKILKSFLVILDNSYPCSIKEVATQIQTTLNCSPKEIWQTLRLALTGETHGPSLDEIMKIYGIQKIKQHISYACQQ